MILFASQIQLNLLTLLRRFFNVHLNRTLHDRETDRGRENERDRESNFYCSSFDAYFKRYLRFALNANQMPRSSYSIWLFQVRKLRQMHKKWAREKNGNGRNKSVLQKPMKPDAFIFADTFQNKQTIFTLSSNLLGRQSGKIITFTKHTVIKCVLFRFQLDISSA